MLDDVIKIMKLKQVFPGGTHIFSKFGMARPIMQYFRPVQCLDTHFWKSRNTLSRKPKNGLEIWNSVFKNIINFQYHWAV